jgi:YebC/PmpR family DNA-binding regulatory protein
MSGHSKWATIKHKKAKEDSKRGKVFTKLIKEITIVARDGGGDPAANPRLRDLIDKAKQANMPQDNITRAIKKGTGELPGVSYEPITFEGYGPYGIAVIVETLTDNKNRTIAGMRHKFSSKGGNLGENGSVLWMFNQMGVIRAISENFNEDSLLEMLIDYDISDIEKEDEVFVITTENKALGAVSQKLKSENITVESAELEWVAKTPMDLDEKQTEKALEFLQAMEEHDDVQNVYTNLG